MRTPAPSRPFADEVLRLADGRLLAWAEWGDPRGSPVVFLHPRPGSRMFCPNVQATAAAGVRLITVDRPGYGGSEPVAEPSLASFAMDLRRLVDHLWLGQFPVVGWSEGGQYAAAGAALLGERVSALGLVAAPAPDDEVSWLSGPTRELGRLAGLDLPWALAALAEFGAPLVMAPERAWDCWDSPPGAIPRPGPEVERTLRAMWREGLRRGAEGLAADVVAGLRPWGFEPSDVATPAHLFYGDMDGVVGLAHARWWERALPDARLTVIAGGRLFPLAAWDDILRAVRT